MKLKDWLLKKYLPSWAVLENIIGLKRGILSDGGSGTHGKRRSSSSEGRPQPVDPWTFNGCGTALMELLASRTCGARRWGCCATLEPESKTQTRTGRNGVLYDGGGRPVEA